MMSKWKYRVIRFVEDEVETFAVREVFYEGETPDFCTIQSTYPASTEGIVGLQLQIDAYQNAMKLPVLDHTSFDTNWEPLYTLRAGENGIEHHEDSTTYQKAAT